MKILLVLVVMMLSLATLQAIKLHDEAAVADEDDILVEQDENTGAADAEPKV